MSGMARRFRAFVGWIASAALVVGALLAAASALPGARRASEVRCADVQIATPDPRQPAIERAVRAWVVLHERPPAALSDLVEAGLLRAPWAVSGGLAEWSWRVHGENWVLLPPRHTESSAPASDCNPTQTR